MKDEDELEEIKFMDGITHMLQSKDLNFFHNNYNHPKYCESYDDFRNKLKSLYIRCED